MRHIVELDCKPNNYLLHVVVPFTPRTLTEYGTAWHAAGPHNSRTLQPLVSNCMPHPFFFGGGVADATSRKSHGDFWGEPLSIAMF